MPTRPKSCWLKWKPRRQSNGLFPKGEENRSDEAKERPEVVPAERFRAEKQQGETGEHRQRYHLLHYLQLEQAERAAIADKSDSVGRHLETILEKCYSPAYQYHHKERQCIAAAELFELEVAVPCESHENVRNDEQQDSVKRFHKVLVINRSGRRSRTARKCRKRNASLYRITVYRDYFTVVLRISGTQQNLSSFSRILSGRK